MATEVPNSNTRFTRGKLTGLIFGLDFKPGNRNYCCLFRVLFCFAGVGIFNLDAGLGKMNGY